MTRILRSKFFLMLITVSTLGFILAQTIKYPEFQSIDKFQLVSVDNGVCSATVDFDVYNPNWFSFKGKELKSDVFYKNKLVAIGYQELAIVLPRKENARIGLNVDFFLDSLKDDLRLLLMKDSIEFTVKVSGRFTAFNIKREMELPLKIASREFVDKMISDIMNEEGVKTEVLKLKEIGTHFSVFDVGFRFSNKLPFDLMVKEINTSVYADKMMNQKVADWVINSGIKIRKKGSELIKGEARINNSKSALSGIVKVLSGNLDYYLNGSVSIEIDHREIKIPLVQHFRVNPLSREVEIID